MDKLFWKSKDKKEVESFSPLQIDMGLSKGLIALTDEEVEAFLNPPKTPDQIRQEILTQINELESKTYRPLREMQVGTEQEMLDASIILGELNEQIKVLRSQL